MAKRVCLVAPGPLPVSATQGGAVETLMTRLIECNERSGRLDLTAAGRGRAGMFSSARFYNRFVDVMEGRA